MKCLFSFQVWDRDVIGKDDLIGESLVSLGNFDFLSQTTHTAWYELRAEVGTFIILLHEPVIRESETCVT